MTSKQYLSNSLILCTLIAAPCAGIVICAAAQSHAADFKMNDFKMNDLKIADWKPSDADSSQKPAAATPRQPKQGASKSQVKSAPKKADQKPGVPSVLPEITPQALLKSLPVPPMPSLGTNGVKKNASH
jgi:hypothetical protein